MKRFAALILASIAALVVPMAVAQSFPTRPITIFINSEPGGANDVIARTIKDRMAAELGQPVLIEFRVGAGGTIGLSALKRMEPNGYSIMLSGPGPVTLAPLLSSVPYDPLNDFEFVNQAVNIPILVGINTSLSPKTLPEFISMAKREPGKYSYASTGNGAPSHLFGERLKQMTGIDLLHVPYRGPPAGALALASGQVSVFLTTSSTLAPFVESGKVRGLVLLNTATRLKSMPEMQTSAEVGMPELTIPSWMGFLAPKGTPPAVIDKLDKAIQAALADPKTKEVFDRLSFEPLGIPGPQFAARLKADSQVWGEVVRKANIKPE